MTKKGVSDYIFQDKSFLLQINSQKFQIPNLVGFLVFVVKVVV